MCSSDLQNRVNVVGNIGVSNETRHPDRSSEGRMSRGAALGHVDGSTGEESCDRRFNSGRFEQFHERFENLIVDDLLGDIDAQIGDFESETFGTIRVVGEQSPQRFRTRHGSNKTPRLRSRTVAHERNASGESREQPAE